MNAECRMQNEFVLHSAFDGTLVTQHVGPIGYGIDEAYRGHHFAERACRILLPLIARHGMRTIWLTCSPDNIASKRTLERLGAKLIDIVPVAPGIPMPEGVVRQKCRFRLDV
jgi:tagatose 1,6-diphosphate aldolase